jgi:hypothetical protein
MVKRNAKGQVEKGSVLNPKGRPKDGESWAGIWRAVTNMTPEELLGIVGTKGDLANAIKKYPQNVQMKYLMAIRIMCATMFEPSSGLLNSMMEREDGKVPDKIDVNSKGEHRVIVEYRDAGSPDKPA